MLKLLYRCYCLHFFQNDAFSMRSTTKWISLPSGSQMCLFVVLIIPSLLTSVIYMLARSAKTPGFTYNIKWTIRLYFILYFTDSKIKCSIRRNIYTFEYKIFIVLISKILSTLTWSNNYCYTLFSSPQSTLCDHVKGKKLFGFISWRSPKDIE